jgi:serine protease AprX
MFGFSMIQAVRSHAQKLDHPLRERMLHLYRPFTWIPCFLHSFVEKMIVRFKKFSVIIELKEDAFDEGCHELHQMSLFHHRCNLRSTFSFISCCSMDVTPSFLSKILDSCPHVKKVYLNREVKAMLDVAVPTARAADLIRGGKELTGKDVTVAVIDTGIHPHKDLDGRIVDFVDFVNQKTSPYDDNGHGTHCAGDVAGNGALSDGRFAGPAPSANLIGVKVLNKMGSGTLETIMQGVDWCIQYNIDNPDKKIKVISMSLGSDAQKFEDENKDPMVQSVEKAWESGIVVCVAAGNSGPNPQTIASPGLSDQVITIGASYDLNTMDKSDDDVASFSSRGPTIYGLEKPDLLAPGVNIVSLRSPNSYLDKLQKSNRVNGDYFILSGTSMATPICAGVVALMLEYEPSLTPDEIKKRLMEGADHQDGVDPNVYGKGYINANRSIPSNE